jgi:hypothetical protein
LVFGRAIAALDSSRGHGKRRRSGAKPGMVAASTARGSAASTPAVKKGVLYSMLLIIAVSTLISGLGVPHHIFSSVTLAIAGFDFLSGLLIFAYLWKTSDAH